MAETEELVDAAARHDAIKPGRKGRCRRGRRRRRGCGTKAGFERGRAIGCGDAGLRHLDRLRALGRNRIAGSCWRAACRLRRGGRRCSHGADRLGRGPLRKRFSAHRSAWDRNIPAGMAGPAWRIATRVAGNDAGEPVLSVAASLASSEPSSAARPTYSTLTRVTPKRWKSSSFAERTETSITRFSWNGPRSLTRTISDRLLRRLVTRA